MRCPERDLCWGRQCTKDASHVNGATAAERLHVDDSIPGDRVTWGSIPDIREAESD